MHDTDQQFLSEVEKKLWTAADHLQANTLEELKAYVVENCVEIDLATPGEEGFKEYEEYEARVQAALNGRLKP